MVEELEEREKAAVKKAKMGKEEETIVLSETERIKEEGRKLREMRQMQMDSVARAQMQPQTVEEDDEDLPPELRMSFDSCICLMMLMRIIDPLDTTVRLKWSLKKRPELTTVEAISNLLAPFGSVDTESIVLSLKAPKKSSDKPPKSGTALAPFKQIGDAYDAVCDSGKAERGLVGVEVGWVNGKAPEILGWLKKMGKLGEPKPPTTQSESGSAFSTFPSTFVSGFVSWHTNSDVIWIAGPHVHTVVGHTGWPGFREHDIASHAPGGASATRAGDPGAGGGRVD